MLLIVLLSFKYGIYGLLIGSVIFSFLALGINIFYTNRFIQYSFLQQFKDLMPAIVLALLVGGALYFLDQLETWQQMSVALRTLVGGVLGGSVYLIFSQFFQFEALHEARIILFKR